LSLTRGDGVALWRQIATQLEEGIRHQTFGPGERLPTEQQLARRFGVNRHTVRRSVASLEDRGLVRAEQGRGTFVQEGILDYQVGKRTRFSETIRRQQKTPKGELLQALEVPADRQVAKALKIKPGAAVIRLDRMGYADDRPLSLAVHYFPALRFPALVEAYRSSRSITAALKKCGLQDYTRQSTKVTTRMPDSEEARLLRTPKTRPILVTESVNVDGDGKPIEFGVARFAGDRVQIVFEPH